LLVAPLVQSSLLPPVSPQLAVGAGIIKNKQMAIALGKALFWDIQAGSEGQACASCHFSAGADSRIRNQLSPGLKKLPTADTAFGNIADYDGEPVTLNTGRTKSGATDIDGTYELKAADFPFHSLTDYKNRNSPLEITTEDVASSSGSFESDFDRVRRMVGLNDRCGNPSAATFHAGVFPSRMVEPRNTPTTINAVFNDRNFWDGRANRIFNGVDVFGPRDIAADPSKRLIVLNGAGKPELGYLQVQNASLASQAVGPPLSELEMSCEGRTFADVGRRLLLRRPLSQQQVHAQDSVLGALRDKSGQGLAPAYRYDKLIKLAFEDKYWKAAGKFQITADGQLLTEDNGTNGHTQMEHNFSAFWGIAIMMYEATLVSDQSKFDTWFASCLPRVTNPGGNATVLVPIPDPVVTCRLPDGTTSPFPPTDPQFGGFTAQEVLGFGLFNNGGTGIRQPGNPSCSGCHPVTNPLANPLVFPTFSEAQFLAGQTFVPVERSRIDHTSPPGGIGANCTFNATTNLYQCGGVHDRGFFNIGVTPASFDPGAGGFDIHGNTLSDARMFVAEQLGPVVDPTGINPCVNNPLIEGGGTPSYPCTGGTVNPGFNWTTELNLVDGTFKTPSLRNVALTPPYFHSGNYSDLKSVTQFYARGGSRRDKSLINSAYTGDTSGTGPLGQDSAPLAGPDFGTNVDFFIRDVKSTDAQIDALVAFMKTLTDPRVQCDQAPFDHPQLVVPNGHTASDDNLDGRADDITAVIPASGAGGYTADGRSDLCLPNSGDLFDPNLRNRLLTP
jgi:cytochrome c peroxidase